MSSTVSSSSAAAAGSTSSSSNNANNKSKTPNPSEVNHAWEAHDAQSTWEHAVREDADGKIVVDDGDTVIEAIRRRRKRLEQNDYSQKNRRVVRDMIRYLYVMVDASRWMRAKDPGIFPGSTTRMEATVQVLQSFVNEFYDQNPLSHLGFILLQKGEAEILTALSSSSSAKAHKLALQKNILPMVAREGPTGGGEFSIQNGLEVAGRSLGHQPRHGSREVVMICGALSTCDPGYVLTETLPRLQAANVRVSTIALAAEMHVCRKISQETGGSLGVALDKTHFRDWLLGQCVPPPTSMAFQRDFSCDMVQMGFPTRTAADVPTLVHASQETTLLTRTAYSCPQCQAKVSELPADCPVCGLKLVLSPHLARSFHHLFPVSPFVECPLSAEALTTGKQPKVVSSSFKIMPKVVLDHKLLISSAQDEKCCFACLRAFGPPQQPGTLETLSSSSLNSSKENGQETLRFQCPECQNFFCVDCDAFMHESLHNCPGCLSR